jgi:beta-mannosidase
LITLPCHAPFRRCARGPLTQEIIPDPYYGTNENDVLWVGRNDWVMEREFTLSNDDLSVKHAILTFTMADTIITVQVNGTVVGTMDNQFRRYRFDVRPLLHEGTNTISLTFRSSEKEALDRASRLKYPIPFSEYPNGSPHRNLVRKASSAEVGTGVPASFPWECIRTSRCVDRPVSY